MEIDIPYRFKPRGYQVPVLGAMDNGVKRFVLIWHRRGGKDKTSWNMMIKRAYIIQGTYYYFFPTYKQGKKILWDGIDSNNKMKFLDHIPEHLVINKNNTEMKLTIETVDGGESVIQIIGTDDYDAIMGTNPIGCVFSEYSLQDPRAWEFIRPILSENGGWAAFIYTPRGKNHGWDMREMAKDNPDWFFQELDVQDTRAIPLEAIEAERRAGMTDNMIRQEYYISFEGTVEGNYYGTQIRKAYDEKRIGEVPYSQELPVDTWWDLGIDDSMTIWFTQRYGNEIRVVDYYENSGEGLPFYVAVLQQKQMEYGINYGEHWAPHDIKVRELSSGKSRWDIARRLGITFMIAPKHSLEDGIDAVRRIFTQCWFDKVKCKDGLKALDNYTKEWNDKDKVFKPKPLHNWASHGADAFRTMAINIRFDQITSDFTRAATTAPSWNPLDEMKRGPVAANDYSPFQGLRG